jgi:trigger factor
MSDESGVFAASRLRSRVEQLPITQALSQGERPLPSIPSPSLEALEVTVEQPAPPTGDELAGRFVELLRELAPRRERAPGEPCALGDELWVDMVGFVDGTLLPGSARFSFALTLVPGGGFPGLAEGLVGAPVGELRRVEAVVGEAPAHPELQGLPVSFAVNVLRAFEVTPLDERRPEDLAKLERGDTLEAVMRSIAGELEALYQAQAEDEAQAKVLALLVERAFEGRPETEALPSREAVDDELRRRWAQQEGRGLAELGLSAEEQQAALDYWLEDAEAREQVRRELRIAMVMKAVAEQERIAPSPEALRELALEALAPFGLTQELLADAVAEDPAVGKALGLTAHQLAVLAHVMARAKVTFVPGR